MGNLKLRCIATLLLLTFPVAVFGQQNTDPKQLERMRRRLSEPAILGQWSATADMSVLAMQIGSCADARAQGRRDAAVKHNANWWWLSIPAGFFLPLIGIGAATAAAAMSHPEPKTIPINVDSACYRDAYGDRARTPNMWTALAGSTIGTALLIALVAASGGFVVMG